MKKRILTTLLLVTVVLCSKAADTESSEQQLSPEYHIGTMWDLSLTKDWKVVKATVQQSIFTIDTELERAMSILSLDVPIVSSHLRFNGLGFYLYYRMAPGQYSHLLRYHAGFSGATPLFKTANGGGITFTWAERFESTYVLGTEVPTNKLRTRVRFVGNIPNSKFQPFIGSEFFLMLNKMNAGRGERLWYDLGVTYVIDKNNKVEFLVREEQLMLTTPRQWNTNIGVAYKVTI